MTFEEIQKIIAQINQSDIKKLELDFEGGHILIDKREDSEPQDVAEKAGAKANKPVADDLPSATIKANKPQPSEPKLRPKSTKIKAPLVGIVYLQPSPDKKQYKTAGDHVKKGEVVCLIEAMKMMTEIKSTISGTVDQILVSNEEVVEYDQPLLTVIPD